MIITSLRVVMEPVDNEHDKGLTAKMIEMNDKQWSLPTAMFPREIRFISSLEALINEFNKGR